MADVGTVVYLPGQEGRRQVRSWRLRVDGGCDRVVAMGTLPGGRWWVAALWEFPTGYGRVYGSEADATDGAGALRDAHPGRWQDPRLDDRRPRASEVPEFPPGTDPASW